MKRQYFGDHFNFNLKLNKNEKTETKVSNNIFNLTLYANRKYIFTRKVARFAGFF